MRLARVVCPTLAISLASVAGGCRHSGKPSDIKEAPDNYGVPSLLGIDPPYSWDSVKDATTGQVQVPWSDTYWPLANRGLAARWAAGEKFTSLPADPQSLPEALESLRQSLTSQDPLATAYLSPAEKYDLVTGRIEVADASFWRAVETLKDGIKPEIKAQIADLKKKNQELRDDVGRYNEQMSELSRQISEEYKGFDTASESDRKRIQDKVAAYANDINTIAKRAEEAVASFKANQKTMRTVRVPYTTQEMELTSRARSFVPMTAESWGTWGAWEISDVDNYLWMGHCHGWALASVVEAAPKHAVMVNKGNRKVLFTEGDVRGLTTKIWANQLPQSKFAAVRCNSENPPKLAGRVSDGMVCLGAGCDAEKGQHIFVKNNRYREGYIEYGTSPFDPHTKFAKFQGGLNNDRAAVAIYDSAADMSQDLSEPNPNISKQLGSMYLGTGCRDINPMTLHLALTKLIHDRKIGFVIDRDRNSEVWNQPVYGYELEYLPIKTRTGASVAGEPVDIGAVSDPLGPFRAPGTAYLVSVQAKINYGVEVEPQLTYASNGADEKTSDLVVTYTLELDKNKNIIGGEWGRMARNNHDVFEPIDAIPDFIWYAVKGTLPSPGAFDVEFLKKIQACAAAPATGKVTLKREGATGEVRDEVLPYADCAI